MLVCGRRPPHMTRDLGRGDGSPCVAFLGLDFAPSVVVVEHQHAPGLPCCCVTPSVCSSLSRSRYERTKQKEIAGASRCAVVLLPLRPWLLVLLVDLVLVFCGMSHLMYKESKNQEKVIRTKDGRIVNNSPWTLLRYFEMTRELDLNDYVWTSASHGEPMHARL